MRRQLLATAAILTATLGVAFAAPAFADHEDPEVVSGAPGCNDIGREGLDRIEFDEDQPTEFDVEAFLDDLPPETDPGVVSAVIVMGGGTSVNVYDEPPFHSVTAPDGKGITRIDLCGGLETPEPTPKPEPTTPVETPVPVPTGVPAGANTGGNGSAWSLGLILAGGAAVAGAAVAVVRRRFLHDS